jgi:hypothetical protein
MAEIRKHETYDILGLTEEEAQLIRQVMEAALTGEPIDILSPAQIKALAGLWALVDAATKGLTEEAEDGGR